MGRVFGQINSENRGQDAQCRGHWGQEGRSVGAILAPGVEDQADPKYSWRDDIWTMKYLSGFKWEMLGEQVGESYRPILPGRDI